jgi:hypothetical protein
MSRPVVVLEILASMLAFAPAASPSHLVVQHSSTQSMQILKPILRPRLPQYTSEIILYRCSDCHHSLNFFLASFYVPGNDGCSSQEPPPPPPFPRSRGLDLRRVIDELNGHVCHG